MAGPGAHSYRPADGHGLKHDPFNAIVAPRPIGWISSRDGEGRANLAPYSFFNALNYTPPLIGFSSVGMKDSLANAQETGAFVWNLATRALAERMNGTSAAVRRGVDEFALAGLTAAPSVEIDAPRVAESPVNFECVTTQIIRLEGRGGQKAPAWFVVGEVVRIHIDPALIENGVFSTEAADPILRGGGPSAYYALGERLDMTRPDAVSGLARRAAP